MASNDTCTLPITLSNEAQEFLAADDVTLPEFKQEVLEKDAQKNWDKFYKRNTTLFYKDRHWTSREFPELSSGKCILLEAGCGVGNFLFPLLDSNPDLFIYACDFSPRAIDFVKNNELYDDRRCKAFQCDITSHEITTNVPLSSVDFGSLIFVLSAIHPDKMVQALKNIKQVLKPGGCVLVRDYGLYDHAMLRFKPGHKLAENHYVRQDNTRAYYFSLEKLDELFEVAGFVCIERSYVQRRTVNKKEEIDVPRIFVQGRYQKVADV
ncbi:tRNA N(3)-methylcytidine methyltransferase METTL6-like [Watersipora subatra]|uniref:tRNA N(3)-methylcytidine methyltransferase METTL6-like n=1 Tax=Watersipora subatra TaxID=2589382 RepID=UPI00355B77BC